MQRLEGSHARGHTLLCVSILVARSEHDTAQRVVAPPASTSYPEKLIFLQVCRLLPNLPRVQNV